MGRRINRIDSSPVVAPPFFPTGESSELSLHPSLRREEFPFSAKATELARPLPEPSDVSISPVAEGEQLEEAPQVLLSELALLEEVIQRLSESDPSAMEDMAALLYLQNEVKEATLPATTFAQQIALFRALTTSAGKPLYYYGKDRILDDPTLMDVGAGFLMVNSYVGAAQNAMKGYGLYRARVLRKQAEELVEQMEAQEVEEPSPERKERIGELKEWLAAEEKQWKREAAMHAVNSVADTGYLVRWTMHVAGSPLPGAVAMPIWGFYLAVSLPQHAYAVQKAQVKVEEEGAWTKKLQEGAGLIKAGDGLVSKKRVREAKALAEAERARVESDKEKLAVNLKNELDKLEDKGQLTSFLQEADEILTCRKSDLKLPPLDSENLVETLLSQEELRPFLAELLARREQALSVTMRNTLRTAAQQKQALYRDVVKQKRSQAWINLALGVAGAVLFGLLLFGVGSGLVTAMMYALPVIGVLLFMYGLYYGYQKNSHMVQLYMSRDGLNNLGHFAQRLYQKMKVWSLEQKLRVEGRSAREIELVNLFHLRGRLRKQYGANPPPAVERVLNDLEERLAGEEPAEGVERQRDLLHRLHEAYYELDRIKEKTTAFDEKKELARMKDVEKVLQDKGIAAASQSEVPDLIANSLADLITKDGLSKETVQLMREQLDIELPTEREAQSQFSKESIESMIASFYTKNNELLGSMIQRSVQGESTAI